MRDSIPTNFEETPAMKELHDKYAFNLIQFANYCYLNDAEAAKDVVQDMFAEMHQRGEEYEPSEEAIAKGRMYETVKNKCLNILKKEKVIRVYVKRAKAVSRLTYDFNETEETEILIQDQIRAVYDAFEQLPPKTLEVMRSHYLDGKQIPTIADEMQLTIKTVYNHLAIGRGLIRDTLNIKKKKNVFPSAIYPFIIPIIQLIKYLITGE